MKIAMIPARGGSKRILRKNIKEFCGKPIIAFSIEAAISCGLFDKVIVSTDDQDIANIAKALGADVPFIRPADISDDYATTVDVIQHAIKWYIHQGHAIDTVCCIYATAPFINKTDLIEAYKLLCGDVRFVFSATEFSYSIFRSFKLTENNRVQMFWPENFSKRSQDLEKAYHDAGIFYYGKADSFLNNPQIFSEYSSPYLLPHYRVQDIDTLDDWYRAEKYYQLLKHDFK